MTEYDETNGDHRTDQELVDELRVAMHERADAVTPQPALQSILARTSGGREQRRNAVLAGPSSRTRRWVPVLVGSVAAASLVTAGVVALDRQGSGGGPAPATSGTRSVTIFDTRVDANNGGSRGPAATNWLVPTGVSTTRSTNAGVDAVTALVTHPAVDPDYADVWSLRSGTPQAITVTSVTGSAGLSTVDLSGYVPKTMVSNDCAASSPQGSQGCSVTSPRMALQQLVQTVQAALGNSDPVQVTVDGSPRATVFGYPAAKPIVGGALNSLAAPVYIQSPAQGATATSPVHVTGQSDTFEGNVVWRVLKGSRMVRTGHTNGGSMGTFGSFAFRVRLVPGTYTVEAYEVSPANGVRQYADTKRITVR
ncbi:MAG: Gmad2 immunoglobulin-like domain-containing protein [Nocardioidaceae bacterium]